MRLCGSDAFRLYSSEDSERGVETGTLCTDRCLMSTVSYNEGASVPGIAHGIVLEHC